MYLKEKGGIESNCDPSLLHELMNFKIIFIPFCLCIPLVDPVWQEAYFKKRNISLCVKKGSCIPIYLLIKEMFFSCVSRDKEVAMI